MKCLVYAITALLFLSCTPDNIKREYEQLKSNRIIMPDYEYAMIKGRDTLVSDCFHEKLIVLLKVKTGTVYHFILFIISIYGGSSVAILGNSYVSARTVAPRISVRAVNAKGLSPA